MSNQIKKERVLVIAHGHPDFCLGGGELAAYNLFKALKEDKNIEEAWFLARHDSGNGPTGAMTLRRENEYLWQQSLGNSFLLKAANSYAIWNDFKKFIKLINPTVVNLHHYFHLGIELFKAIKDVNPSIKVILTLHEYMAICHQQGQMVKAGSNKLCFKESIEDCSRCIPAFSKEDYWLRKNFIQNHFSYIDHFISPSHFLKERYVDWGIPEQKITVIENGQSPDPWHPPREINEGEKRNRIAFFGQINPFKGIDILLKAMLVMSRADRKNIIVEIHGANFEHQQDIFKAEIQSMAEKLIKEGTLRWVGSYEPFQIKERMKNIDWVVIPSIWWENSPMVIQEAFCNGIPVISSNIGGMAEKITDGVDGMHFECGNPLDLAERLLKASSMGDSEWKEFHYNIKKPLDYNGCAQIHKKIFEGL